MKQLIINADDFGLCESINKGILECYLNGIVSDFSFLINSENFDKSVKALKDNRIKHFGIHVNLTFGKSLSGNISSMTDKNGNYLSTVAHFKNYLKGKINPDEVYTEVKRQLDLLTSHGFEITHIDTHQNIHILPPVYSAVNKAKNDYNPEVIIRFPCEPLSFNLRYKPSNFKRIFILNALSRYSKFKNGIDVKVQAIGGDFYNNKNNKEVIRRVVRKIGKLDKDIFEMAVHPGYYSDEILKYDGYAHPRERELEFLSKPNDIFSNNSIKLISFKDIIVKKK
jgi:predicted glycoside hydrolase/deacetylase ChbG (UPF0249 family)